MRCLLRRGDLHQGPVVKQNLLVRLGWRRRSHACREFGDADWRRFLRKVSILCLLHNGVSCRRKMDGRLSNSILLC
jgi:hypothetical protein